MNKKSSHMRSKDSEKSIPLSFAFISLGVFLGAMAGIIALLFSYSLLNSLIIYFLVSMTIPIIFFGWWYKKTFRDDENVLPTYKGKILLLSTMCREILDNLKLLPELSSYTIEAYSSEINDTLINILNQKSYDFIFLDIDFLQLNGISMMMCIDNIREFRNKNPGVAIILLSKDFSKDNSEIYRIEICDTSLRLPVSHSRLFDAIKEASENNIIWCQRRKLGT